MSPPLPYKGKAFKSYVNLMVNVRLSHLLSPLGGGKAGGATMVGTEAEISKICSSRLPENAFQEHLVQF